MGYMDRLNKREMNISKN